MHYFLTATFQKLPALVQTPECASGLMHGTCSHVLSAVRPYIPQITDHDQHISLDQANPPRPACLLFVYIIAGTGASDSTWHSPDALGPPSALSLGLAMSFQWYKDGFGPVDGPSVALLSSNQGIQSSPQLLTNRAMGGASETHEQEPTLCSEATHSTRRRPLSEDHSVGKDNIRVIVG